jgi:hypothetical protein
MIHLTGPQAIGMGQYMEAREIWGYVVSSLESACDATNDTEV